MNKRNAVASVMAAAMMIAGCAYAGALKVSRMAWRTDAEGFEFTIKAEASPQARHVYLVWDDEDRGENFLAWPRGELVGQIAANATSATLKPSFASRYPRALRFFTFATNATGDGYLTHIESTGTQYIDTGIKPNYKSAAWVDYALTDTKGQQRIFSSGKTFVFEHYISGSAASGGNLAYACKDTEGNWKNYGNTVNKDRVALLLDSYCDQYDGRFRIDRNGVAICSVTVKDHVPVANRTKTSTENLRICEASGGNNATKMKLYRFKLSNAGTLQMDLRPYAKNGVVGCIDTVSGNFFANAKNNTSFIAGTLLGTNTLDVSDALGLPNETEVSIVSGGVYEVSNLPGGPQSELNGTSSLILQDVVLKYSGREGEKGYYEGDVHFGATNNAASTFDITGDLTLSGRIENRGGYGAFVKTGPGTLRIPGEPNKEYLWKLRGPGEPGALDVFTTAADGLTPTKGYTCFTLAEGRLVLGENGGNIKISHAGGTDIQIGRLTVDPANPNGGQEKDAVLEIAGGTNTIENWVNVGGKNGFVTTQPHKIPESGIRVTGGLLHCKGSLTLGRNKKSMPQNDANGNPIEQRTRPFIEVLGGKMQLWNTSRIGLCDDSGADSRVLVDKGTFYVCNKDNTSGSGIQLGCCSDGVADALRHCDITVRNGGTFDITDFYIANGKTNITSDIKIIDSGIYRNNKLRKVNTHATCSLNILFDGGIAEIRYAGYTDWINGDVTKAAIGTRGATFRSSSTANANVLDYVQVPLVSEDTHPDEEPRGLVVSYKGSDKNSGFVFTNANTYKGPTLIDKYGRLEFAGTGAFPATSDVTLGQGGRLAITNMAHTVKSFTIGNSMAAIFPTELRMKAGAPLTAGAFSIVGAVNVQLHLFSAPNVALSAPGTYELVRGPSEDAVALKAMAAQMTWANAPNGRSASFAVAVDGDNAVLSATVVEGAAAALHPAAGGTETIETFEGALDAAGMFRLGSGTIAYTGSGETVSGLVNCASGKNVSTLDIANDLTLLDYTTLNGIFYKKGAGDLKLMGTGEFVLGNGAVSFDIGKPIGFDDAGNAPTHGLLGAQVADGRLIIGVKDDPENAPHVVVSSGIGVGVRTVARDSGKFETAGEIIMNNGVLDTTVVYVDYYNGYDETTPPEGLTPKFTQNGGEVNVDGELRISQDYYGSHASSPTFELNGGTFRLTGNANVGQQASTGRVNTVNTFRMNGGDFYCANFNVGNDANASKARVELKGGDLHCLKFTRTGKSDSTDKGYAEVLFDGTVIHIGYGRSFNSGFEFGSDDANKRISKAYVGAGGFVLDFDEWMMPGEDGGQIDFRQPLLHDPDCDGEDGGVTLRNGAGFIIRQTSNGSTFTGPVTIENGSFIGIQSVCDWFTGANVGRKLICKPRSGMRLSNQANEVGTLEIGEEDATDPVYIDLCNPSGTEKGLVATHSLNVKSPVTATFHRGGGMSIRTGVWFGTTDLLLYPASQDANVPLEMFVSNPRMPEVKMTFAKQDVTSGTYAGYKKIVVTVENAYDGGTVWKASETGAWTDGTKWEGGEPANGTNVVAQFAAATSGSVAVNVDETPTVGRIVLNGADAAKGYSLSGEPVNLHTDAWNIAPDVVAVSGSHTVANDLLTDSRYATSSETTADGGRTGAIAVKALSGAMLTVTGSIATDAKRDVYVNPVHPGGGKTVLDGEVTSGTGVTLRSGTMELADFRKLNGKTLTVGPGTLHYTGPNAVTESKIVFAPGATNLSSVIRVDNKLTVNAAVTTSGNIGNVMKTGAGELVLNGKGANRLGGVSYNPDWNKIVTWPANGDSYVMSSSAFCLDEGTITVGRDGQTALFGSGWTDIFIGSQPRGWAYSTDTVKFNVTGGAVSLGYCGIGHGMRRGTDADMSAPCYVELNQYDGIITNVNLYMNYELTKYDSHIRATLNLHGGKMVTLGYVRFGQCYNKTGINEPSATANIYPGAVWEFARTQDDRRGNFYIPYSASEADLKKYRNRAPDATLNMEGGEIKNAYLLILGHNGGRGEIHLNGGVLNCENIVHYPVEAVRGVANYYQVFTLGDGKSCVYFNGGVFQPVSAMNQSKDSKNCELFNATLTNLYESVVQAGGARFDLSKLAAARYTIAQALTGAEGDGGLVKTGTKPLVLAERCTYFGDTVIEEGNMLIGRAAPAGEILPNSAVRVKAGATLEFEEGTRATVSKLVVDCAGTAGTIANLKVAPEGTLCLENVTAERLSGYSIPLAITGTARVNMSGWTTYVNGEKVEGNLRPTYRNGAFTLSLPQETILTFR